jgi:tetratricopeptide (TPR) repeat protein
LLSLPRRHPYLAGLALVLLTVAPLAAYQWGRHQLGAARQALQRRAFDEADRHLARCLKLPFFRADAHLLAAQAARRRDAYTEAEKHLAACEKAGGRTRGVTLEWLLLDVQQGELDGVDRGLRARAAGDEEDAVLILEALARGYASRFWRTEAVECLNELLRLQPDHVEALLLRARLGEELVRAGRPLPDYDPASDYQHAIALSPTFAARLGLAGALDRAGRPEDAGQIYEQLRGEQPDNPQVLLGLARCRYALSDVEEARRLLEELLRQQPAHGAGLLERGRLELHAGRLAEAETWLRRAADAAVVAETGALRSLCQCLEAEHKDAEARRYGDRLQHNEAEMIRVNGRTFQANRAPDDVALRFAVAGELMHLGREEDAVAALFVVVEQEPRHRQAHAALANYFTRTEQPRRAARHRLAASAADSLLPAVRP